MLIGILKLISFVLIAILMGKLVAKVKLPAILGWLITGIIIGPYALGWMSQELLDSTWFKVVVNIVQVGIGMLIGTELIWEDIKKSGKQILTICFTEAMGAFLVVTLAFGVIFAFTDIPLYLAFIFGGIALATAPAPSLSIINEYKANGPVSKTLIPLAALDDVIGLAVFFTVIGVVSGMVSGGSMPLYIIPLMIILPVVLGVVLGWAASFILRKDMNKTKTRITTFTSIVIVGLIGMTINHLVGSELLNLMLVGVSFTATFANLMKKERLHQINNDMNPIVGIIMVIGILYLGAPLDYHLIIGAGAFTFIYIVARAIGKIGGAYFGARVSKAPDTVKKYLGLTLLPHSGVSLIFTGIAVTTLSPSVPEYAKIIQGTIAAAAVINEIIAVFLARQGFKWAGELDSEEEVKECTV
ncbi:cation:proton antiporter [Clostridium sp.]|uniref:cation:proton antiporter n=1 Tax=Clostridium sp. TaxID=1506 RepID=UPI003F4153A5